MKGKIVFISHQASLSGAPILLLNILVHLKDKLPYDFVTVLGSDGPIRSRFEEVGEVIIYPEVIHTGKLTRVLRRLQLTERYGDARIRKVFEKLNVKLIFSNTIVNGSFIDKININKAPVITYVHELAYAIEMQNPVYVRSVLQHTAYFLAGSGAVQQQLATMGIEPEKIRVIPSSVPYDALATQLATIAVEPVRAELGLQAHEQVLVAVGAAEWRKGNDLFMQMASSLATQRSHVHFVWVGVPAGSPEYLRMKYDIVHLGLEGRFHLVPVTPDYLKYIALADVFVLPSREDPFPLVVLEAAVASKPTVCFANTGGSPEFVGTDNGVVVPYGDVATLASTLLALLDDTTTRLAKGESARAKVQQQYNIPIIATQIAQVIEQYAG